MYDGDIRHEAIGDSALLNYRCEDKTDYEQ